MKVKLYRFISLLALLVGLTQTVNATVTFTVTPSTVSNTYNGPITLQVTGLTNTETVVIQKFLDANTNGVIDAGDYLWQQFNLTDGTNFVIGGVTNNNVPGDTDGTANGTITATLNFQSDFLQTFDGKYFFKLSSPVGHFTPLTNSFTVTNFPYAQKFTGTVVSNGVAVPNAVVILFPAGANGNPVGGAVANNSGIYTLPSPTGTYSLVAVKSNFVANFNGAANLLLSSSATFTTNLSLIPATQSISGKIVDANNSSIGLPGLLVPVQTQDRSLLALCFTDTNGNFTARVNANQWGVDSDSAGLAFHGYVGLNDKMTVDTTTGSVSGVTIVLPKGTACFYGTVKDNLGNPLPGSVAIESEDNNQNNNGNSTYQSDGYTDTNGNYVTVVVGGLGSSDTWQPSIDNASSWPNYIFSQSPLQQNGGTNMTVGKVVHQNFTAIFATNHITGNVSFNGTNVVGVQVDAYATINGNNYQAQADTDSSGNYSLNVANGSGGTTWSVNIYDCGCDDNDSLNTILGNGNYQEPNNQNTTINNNNQTVNFTIQPSGGGSYQIFGYVTDNFGDPVDGVDVHADDGVGDVYTSTTDETGYYSINVGNGNWDVSVDCSELSSDGYGCPSDQEANVSGGNVEEDFTVQSNSLQINNSTSLPDGTNGTSYSFTFQASGGTPPYGWYVPDYSASLPANLSLATNGVLSGTLSTAVQTYYFYLDVTDSVANFYEEQFTLNVVNPPLPPLVITNVSLPNGNVGAAYSAQLGATGGQSPYYWSLATGSANPPAGLTLYSSGLISGTPTTNKVSSFKVQVNDSSSDVTNKILSITINPKPVLGLPGWLTNQFQMRLTGGSNQNYTIQVSTNLSSTNWTTLFITNNAVTNSFIVVDPNATNKQRFYRAVVGP